MLLTPKSSMSGPAIVMHLTCNRFAFIMPANGVRRKMEQLTRLRRLNGLSQRALAKESGVSPATIYELENDRRNPNPSTLRKLARALGVEVADLLGEAEHPLAQAPAAEQRSFDNHIREEQRADWENAVSNARQLREHAQARAEELMAFWRQSKNRKEDPAERRAYLDEMGELLQAAYDVRPTLFQAMSYQRLPEQWPELGEADQFYRDLWDLVQSAGLSIRAGNAQEERPEAVEETEAA